MKVIVFDKWKEGVSNIIEGGGWKINENKLFLKKSRCVFGIIFVLFFFIKFFELLCY